MSRSFRHLAVRSRRARCAAAALAGTVFVTLAACGGGDRPAPAGAATAGGEGVVRVDQVGYAAGRAGSAVLLSPRPAAGATVVARTPGHAPVRLRLGARLPAWSARFPAAYAIDLAPLRASGTWTLAVSGPVRAVSPPVHIGPADGLFAPVAAAAVGFLTAQRDGPDVPPGPLGRRPSHLADAHALQYAAPAYRRGVLMGGLRQVGGPVDVSGGWMDSGDTLKFAETSSFTEIALLLALRDDAAGLGAAQPAAHDEAAFGLDWLLRLWNPQTRRLVYQVGLGDGNNASILGAHETTWRLPQADDALRATPGSPEYYVKYRPAFVTGPQISPNLAGRLTAAYALGAQVLGAGDPGLRARALNAAESLYAAARTNHVGRLVTAVPYGYYPEIEWRDDMELGAAELALATAGTPAATRHLGDAERWADAYAASPLNGTDSLNLYDVAALAHTDTVRAMAAASAAGIADPGRGRVTVRSLAQDLNGQAALGAALARRDPFGFLGRYRDDDVVAHALGWSVEAAQIDALQRAPQLAAAGARQRDLVLGRNAWGTSFVVGAGTLFPRCLHHPVANLSGSLDGRAPLLTGAVVAGPTSAAELRGQQLATPTGARRCPVARADPFARFDARGAAYRDTVGDSANTEPSIDLAGLAVLSFARAAEGR